jgi:hypothetical protein
MLPLLIVIIITIVVAIGSYQLLIQKYYWGPKGPPGKNDRKKESRKN